MTEKPSLSTKIEKELEILETNKCHTCGQDFHDDAHTQVFDSKKESLEEANVHIGELAEVYVELEKEKDKIGEVGEKPNTFYSSETEAIEHKNRIKDLTGQVNRKEQEENPYTDQIIDMEKNALQEFDFDIELMNYHA